MQHLRAAGFAALFALIGTIAALAQDVTLTSRDGSVSVTGTLLRYDGELYRVATDYGVLTIDGFKVDCDGPGCPDLTALVSELRIAGSRTMGDVLMPALVETYAARKNLRTERRLIDDTNFDYALFEQGDEGRQISTLKFRISSTAEGFADLIVDEADLVLATREATKAEVARGIEAGLGDLDVARRSQIVGLDALVPVVSRRNPIDTISIEVLAQIFAGEITDWSEREDWAELGLSGPIALHMRSDQSGHGEEFRRRVLGALDLSKSAAATAHDSNVDVSDEVARDPNALGVASYSQIGNAKALDLVGACGKRISATAATLKTEDYPLTTPLFLYTPRGRPSPLTRDFTQYVRSRFAQPVIARSGFVDLRVREVPLASQGQRLANAISAAGAEVDLNELQRLVEALEGTSRLTLSFRFEPGGTRLDAQSRSNIDTLASVLELGRFDDRTVVFVGFTDGEGPAAGNMRLARRRADTVRKAVMRAAPAADRDRLDIQVEAFGEGMPMACDDNEWGKSVNRRVEVWVK